MFPPEGIASILMLALMFVLASWGIISPHFHDNLGQRLGLCIVATACLLAIPPRLANPSAAPHLLLATSGLLSFGIGTAWKVWRHRKETEPKPKAGRTGWIVGTVLAVPLLWLGIPAVTGSAEVVEKQGDSVLVRMWGSRIRGDECVYRGVVAYAEGEQRIREHIDIERVDRRADGRSLPPGHYNFGLWLVGPLPAGTQRIIIRVDHSCGGMAVTARLAVLRVG